MIVNFLSEIIITRLKHMYGNLHTRMNLNGLWSIVLLIAVSLLMTSCEEKSKQTHKKNKGSTQNVVVAQIFKGHVKKIQGGARLKYLNGMPRSVSIGQKVFENNMLLTEAGGGLVLSVADGSAFMMDGKSEVELDAKKFESLKQRFMISLHYGKLFFDVQKQAVRDEFEIRTEKLASITQSSAGFVEKIEGLEIYSIKEGRHDVSLNDSVIVIKGGQTLLANDNGIKIMTLAGAGSLILARTIETIVLKAVTTQGTPTAKLNLDKITSLIKTFDNAYKKKSDGFIKKNRAQFKPKILNEYIGKPSVTLEALFMPGSIVSVQGFVDTIPESGIYKRTFEWADSTAFGPKRFVVNCSNGEVEYICHTWITNFVSARMAEVLTKADERKTHVVKDTAQQPKILKPTVVIEGSGRERIHVLPEERDIPATLRFSVAGLMGADLKQIKKIVVKRKGAIIKTFSGDELMTNSFKLPLRLKQNRIAHIEIWVYFVNGKRIKGRKDYETYCYFENYEGGKKSNRISDMTAEEEYKNVVSKRLLKNE